LTISPVKSVTERKEWVAVVENGAAKKKRKTLRPLAKGVWMVTEVAIGAVAGEEAPEDHGAEVVTIVVITTVEDVVVCGVGEAHLKQPVCLHRLRQSCTFFIQYTVLSKRSLLWLDVCIQGLCHFSIFDHGMDDARTRFVSPVHI
jgi:hypothetical protein